MAKREIKCPHCKNWTSWTEALYDRCKTCNAFIEQEKIDRLNNLAAQKEIDEAIEQIKITHQNPYLRKAGSYAKTIAVGFIAVLTAIIVLAAG